MDGDAMETFRAVYRTAQDRDLTFLAAGVAYYAFVSFIPLILLALAVGSLVGGESLAQRLIEAAGGLLPAAGDQLLTDALTTEAGRTEATVVALGVAAWSGLKVFRGLSQAFDAIYDTVEEDSLLEQLRQGVVVIVAIAAALTLMVAMGVVLGFLTADLPLAGLSSWVVLLFGLILAFLPTYYLLPPIPVDVREVLPGAALAAVGWTVLQAGFQLYAANAGRYEAYGAVGAVLLFVTWLYFAAILILVGAVINVVLSRPQVAE